MTKKTKSRQEAIKNKLKKQIAKNTKGEAKANYPACVRAQLGNKNALKYKTSKERQDICKKFIDHIRRGYSKHSFEHCSHETIDLYIANFPEDFPPDDIEAAFRVGRFVWEGYGHGLVSGALEGNATAWFRIMQNQYDYRDRYDVTSEEKGITNAPVDLTALTDEALIKIGEMLESATRKEMFQAEPKIMH